MKNFFRYLTLFCCAIAFFSFVTNAQIKPETINDLNTSIRKNSKTTYSDLVNLVFSETENGTRKSVPLSNIFGDYKNEVYEGNFKADLIRAVWVNNEGQRQLLLLINFSAESGEDNFPWGDMNVLALFDIQDMPKLIDAVDVQTDRFAFFSEEQPILHTSSRTDAFLMVNHHFNSGESFINLSLIGIVKNRFKIILDDIKTLIAVNSCGLNYEEKASLKLAPANSKTAYRNITLNRKYIRRPDEPECEQKSRGYTKNFSHVYVWNNKSGKYVKRQDKK